MTRRTGGAPPAERPAPKRRSGGLRRLPDLLGRVLDPAARRRGLAEVRLLADWAVVVGSELASRCHPARLTPGGVLDLHVGGGGALEVQHSELQLIDRINGYFGHPAVTRLRLVQTPYRRPPAATGPPPLPPLTESERGAVEAEVRQVEDEALRQALAALGGAVRATGKRRSNS